MDSIIRKYGRVGVLMGGCSSEREISLKSGQAVYEALCDEGCDAIALDIVEIKEEKIAAFIQQANINMAFIVLHGVLGEDGVIQSILENLNIPYTGSGVVASQRAFNKITTLDLFQAEGLNVPDYVVLSKKDSVDLDMIINQLKCFPMVVKPSCEGSSIGISIVKDRQELSVALELSWQYGDEILCEQYIDGRELTGGILDQQALPVIEICSHRHFFDFKAKYNKGMTDYIVPAELSTENTAELQNMALKAHRILGCEDFSRVDFMWQEGKPYILEVNTIPGFTATSLLPQAAQAIGLSFNQLCLKLMELVYGKKEKKQNTAGVL